MPRPYTQSPNSCNVIPLSPHLSLLRERWNDSLLSFCLILFSEIRAFLPGRKQTRVVLFRSKEIAGLDSTDFWQQLCLGKIVMLAAKWKTLVCWSSLWPLWMFLLIPGRWRTSLTLRHSSDFCSRIPVPSQTGLSNGARVKATGSHKDGWDQEFMCRQQSQRCLGRSPLFAEVE